MYQQQQRIRHSSIDSSLDHKLDMLMLSIITVCFFSCLIRTDFDFVAIFFSYFIWQQRKDGLSLKLIMACVATIFAYNIIFMLTQFPVWTAVDEGNPVWQTIRPLHNFGIFCFCVTFLLKIVLIVYVGKAISETNKAVQAR